MYFGGGGVGWEVEEPALLSNGLCSYRREPCRNHTSRGSPGKGMQVRLLASGIQALAAKPPPRCHGAYTACTLDNESLLNVVAIPEKLGEVEEDGASDLLSVTEMPLEGHP